MGGEEGEKERKRERRRKERRKGGREEEDINCLEENESYHLETVKGKYILGPQTH